VANEDSTWKEERRKKWKGRKEEEGASKKDLTLSNSGCTEYA
jgi:hypothetical protein